MVLTILTDLQSVVHAYVTFWVLADHSSPRFCPTVHAATRAWVADRTIQQ
jgi:hypothetical protein